MAGPVEKGSSVTPLRTSPCVDLVSMPGFACSLRLTATDRATACVALGHVVRMPVRTCRPHSGGSADVLAQRHVVVVPRVHACRYSAKVVERAFGRLAVEPLVAPAVRQHRPVVLKAAVSPLVGGSGPDPARPRIERVRSIHLGEEPHRPSHPLSSHARQYKEMFL